MPSTTPDFRTLTASGASSCTAVAGDASNSGSLSRSSSTAGATGAGASCADADCAALRAEISARRAANMRLFAADLRATGELRPDLSDDEVADVVWSMNSAEYRALLVTERGWSTDRYAAWLADAWTRLLLA